MKNNIKKIYDLYQKSFKIYLLIISVDLRGFKYSEMSKEKNKRSKLFVQLRQSNNFS